MNHVDRIDTIIGGDKPDRIPVSFWRHFFHLETTASGLAQAMLDFQRRYDWDLMKVNPRASYHTEVWGAEVEYSGDEFRKPQIVRHPVNLSSDWNNIVAMNADAPALTEQLQVLEQINKELNGSVYFVQTVFSPLSIAGDLVSKPEVLINNMDTIPSKVHQALRNITDTFMEYCKAILKTGAAGIFFATTEWATKDALSEERYLEFGKPYDLEILNAVSDARFNVLHVCKANNMLPLFTDYPFHILSYADKDPGNIGFDKAYELFPDKVILGGIGAKDLLQHASPEELRKEAEEKLVQIPSSRLILGPSCSIPPETPEKSLTALREWAESYKLTKFHTS